MKPIKVTILGKQFPLKINEGDDELMHQIAAFVDQRFRDFKNKLSNQNETTIMTLAALSIAEELFLEKEKKAGNTDDEEAVMEAVNSSLTEILADFKHKKSDIKGSQ